MRTIHRNNYDPQLGDYHERIVIDDAREKRWLFDCDGVYNDITQVQVADELGDSPTHAISQRAATEGITNLQDALMTEVSERQAADRELEEAIDEEALARAEADAAIEQEIQDIKDNPDVVDIVATYADLQNYDTSELGDKDVIRVLADETHEGESSYYRWSTDTSTWTFIGATGPYYTKDEVDDIAESLSPAYIYEEYGGHTTLSHGLRSDLVYFYKDENHTEPFSHLELYELISTGKEIRLSSGGEDYVVLSPAYGPDASDAPISFSVAVNDSYGIADYSSTYDYATDERGAFWKNHTQRDHFIEIKDTDDFFDPNLDNMFGDAWYSGLYKLSVGRDTMLLPKGVEGNANFQLKINANCSAYVFVLSQRSEGVKYLVFGASSNSGGTVQVALIEPSASAKIKLWTQPVDNLTTSSFDGKKVLSARQGKVLADMIGNLSNLQTSAKNNIVAAINELVAGGSINVVQTTGTSTSDVMSQNATTRMIFQDAANQLQVRIGNGSSAGTGCLSVYGQAVGPYGIALGHSSRAQGQGTIAFTFGAATTQGVMQIGLNNTTSPFNTYGYNNSAYRLLTGLYDPQSDHDAATKGYVDTAVATAGAATINSQDWSSLWQ